MFNQSLAEFASQFPFSFALYEACQGCTWQLMCGTNKCNELEIFYLRIFSFEIIVVSLIVDCICFA